MQIPLELSFRHFEPDERIRTLIRRKADKLEKYCDYISGCRIAVEEQLKEGHSGNPFRVRIDVTVPPGHELAVTKGPGEGEAGGGNSLEPLIHSAFEAMARQLKELNERQSGRVNRHEEPTGFVVRLMDGYGFIKTESEREIFFQASAVPAGDFDRIEVGTQVRFVEQPGEKGPQASTVQIVDKPGSRVSGDDRVPAPPGWGEND